MWCYTYTQLDGAVYVDYSKLSASGAAFVLLINKSYTEENVIDIDDCGFLGNNYNASTRSRSSKQN